MIASSVLLLILLALCAAGLVVDHRTGWLASKLTDEATRFRSGQRRSNRR